MYFFLDSTTENKTSGKSQLISSPVIEICTLSMSQEETKEKSEGLESSPFSWQNDYPLPTMGETEIQNHRETQRLGGHRVRHHHGGYNQNSEDTSTTGKLSWDLPIRKILATVATHRNTETEKEKNSERVTSFVIPTEQLSGHLDTRGRGSSIDASRFREMFLSKAETTRMSEQVRR